MKMKYKSSNYIEIYFTKSPIILTQLYILVTKNFTNGDQLDYDYYYGTIDRASLHVIYKL